MWIGVLAGMAQTKQVARGGCIAGSTFKPEHVVEMRGEMRRV